MGPPRRQKMPNSASRELVSEQGWFLSLGNWGNLSKIQKSIQKQKWDRAALLLCLLQPTGFMLQVFIIQKKTNPMLVIEAITATIKSTTHAKEMQVRQDQGQARAGSQTHRKTTTKSTKKLTSPWIRKDFDDRAIKAQINEMQKQYVHLDPTYTRTHTYTLIFNDTPPPRHSQNSPTLGH